MIFAAKDTITGVPAKMVRDFFRKSSGYPIDCYLIEEICRIKPAKAVILLEHCIAQGWLELREDGTSYKQTGPGRQVAAARIGKAISRATADILVSEILERAVDWNNTPGIQSTIEEIRVFGSYLTDKTALGDVDLAVKFKRVTGYPNDGFELEVERFAKLHGHAFPKSFWARLTFWDDLAIRTLKAQQTAVSFATWEILERLGSPYKTIFQARCG